MNPDKLGYLKKLDTFLKIRGKLMFHIGIIKNYLCLSVFICGLFVSPSDLN